MFRVENVNNRLPGGCLKIWGGQKIIILPNIMTFRPDKTSFEKCLGKTVDILAKDFNTARKFEIKAKKNHLKDIFLGAP